MAKIIYFTASAVPTEDERSAIAAINASIHTLNVSNSSVDNGLGTIEECDFVAGKVPSEYEGKPVFDPSSGELEDNQAIVADGDTITVDGATVTLAVADNAIMDATLPATSAVVASGGTIPVQNSAGAAIGAGTLAVAANEPSNIRLPATIAGVANAGAANVLPASGSTPLAAGTVAVAAGVLTGIRLAATAGIVTNGQTIPVTGGTVTITVAANAVTAEFTPE